MPIISTDIQYRLSGGAANSDVNASLGGAKSSNSLVSATSNNFFDAAASAELSVGDVEYRCFYVHNNHGSLTLQNAVVWLTSNTPSADTTIDIGLGSSAVNGTEQTVANESTAPTSVTFSAPATEGAALALGNIPAGQHKAVWLRRTITAGAAAFTDDACTIRVKGDTAA